MGNPRARIQRGDAMKVDFQKRGLSEGCLVASGMLIDVLPKNYGRNFAGPYRIPRKFFSRGSIKRPARRPGCRCLGFLVVLLSRIV